MGLANGVAMASSSSSASEHMVMSVDVGGPSDQKANLGLSSSNNGNTSNGYTNTGPNLSGNNEVEASQNGGDGVGATAR